MLRKLLTVAVLVLIGFGLISISPAQGQSANGGRRRTLVDQLDQLSRNLFGEPPADKYSRPEEPEQGAAQTPSRSRSTGFGGSRIKAVKPKSTSPRAGSVIGQLRQQPGADDSQGRLIPGVDSAEANKVDPFFLKSKSAPSYTRKMPQAPKFEPQAVKADKPRSPDAKPLHERLSAFRKSTFVSSTPPGSPAKPSGKADTVKEPSTNSGLAAGLPKRSKAQPTLATDASKSFEKGLTAKTTSRKPTPAGVLPATTGSHPLKARTPTPAPPKSPRVAPTERPRVAQRTVPKGSAAKRPDAAKPAPTATPAVTSTRSANADRVLFVRQSPILNVATVGPKRIMVGRESAYELTIRNSGEVAATDVLVTVDLPEWAEVLGAQASSGSTRSATPGQGVSQFQWKLDRLEAKGEQKLVLRIIPRQRRPIDLAVKWNYTPLASQAVIEVQEPKLSMRLEGPREVLYGKKEMYRLEFSNTGNGDAENVMITLAPLGPGQSLPTTHRLGTIRAGDKTAIEVEVTARQAGDMTINVGLRGDGGVRAELSEKILVLRPAIKVDVEGPKVQYVGTTAVYTLHLGNPGSAAAENLNLTAAIPPGAKYVASDPPGQLELDQSKVTWSLDHLAPGAERTFVVQCVLGLAGASRLDVYSTADGDLAASDTATTEVEAIADLVLDISDPTGPVPVGAETAYQMKIRNRGTKRAEGVDVTAYFSHGIEPISVAGSQYKIGPGQVVFDTIESLAAGEDLVLTINARASKAGNHLFRAELYCKPLGTRLVGEETTHFYDGGPLAQRSSRTPTGDNPGSVASRIAPQTAGQPQQDPTPAKTPQPRVATSPE